METFEMRTRISKGYQVVVPSQLRRIFNVKIGDEVVWIVGKDEVKAQFRKKPSLENIVSLGNSGMKRSSVELKKQIQRGEI